MNRMTRFLMALLALAFLMFSCNKGPGEGGTGTIQGVVKLVHHPDDDYTLTPESILAMMWRPMLMAYISLNICCPANTQCSPILFCRQARKRQ